MDLLVRLEMKDRRAHLGKLENMEKMDPRDHKDLLVHLDLQEIHSRDQQSSIVAKMRAST